MRHLLTLTLLLICASSTFAQRKTVWIGYNGLCCDQTTEHGEDEVYFITSAVVTDGHSEKKYSQRYPLSEGSDDQIDMNDGDDDENHCFKDRHNLIGLVLDDGDKAIVVVNILEQDGGTSKPWKDLADEVGNGLIATSATDEGLGAVVGGVVKLLAAIFPDVEDTDDWIGTYGVEIFNNNGVITSKWTQVSRYDASKFVQDFAGVNTAHMGFNGDGSKYRIDARLYVE